MSLQSFRVVSCDFVDSILSVTDAIQEVTRNNTKKDSCNLWIMSKALKAATCWRSVTKFIGSQIPDPRSKILEFLVWDLGSEI